MDNKGNPISSFFLFIGNELRSKFADYLQCNCNYELYFHKVDNFIWSTPSF